MQELSSVTEIIVVDKSGERKLFIDRIAYVGPAAKGFLLIDDIGNQIICELDIAFFFEQLPSEKFYRINSNCIVCIDNVSSFIVSPGRVTVFSNIGEVLKTDTLDPEMLQEFIEWLEYN
jgi:DNA-binding LytR/AlgR family response regulator